MKHPPAIIGTATLASSCFAALPQTGTPVFRLRNHVNAKADRKAPAKVDAPIRANFRMVHSTISAEFIVLSANQAPSKANTPADTPLHPLRLMKRLLRSIMFLMSFILSKLCLRFMIKVLLGAK